MKGLLYGIVAIAFAFSLTACSEAQFTSTGEASQKATGLGGEEVIPVEEVPEEELDEYVDLYKCSEAKKRSCDSHDSEDYETPSAKKALVCHNGRVEICISVNALKAHIGRHDHSSGIKDYFGACKDLDGDSDDDDTDDDSAEYQ
jgi:hypothetical protein